MPSELDKKLEKLAHNLYLAFELLDRVQAGESVKGMMAGLTSPFGSTREAYKSFEKVQDNFTQKEVIEDPRYKDAISVLETEFGHIESVQETLRKVYDKCPALKPQTAE